VHFKYDMYNSFEFLTARDMIEAFVACFMGTYQCLSCETKGNQKAFKDSRS
jgi:hypothetical protein